MSSELYPDLSSDLAELKRDPDQPREAVQTAPVKIASSRPDELLSAYARSEATGIPLAEIQRKDAEAAAIANSGAARKLEAAESEFRKAQARYQTEAAAAEGIAAQFRLLRERVSALEGDLRRGENRRAYWQGLIDDAEKALPKMIGMQSAPEAAFFRTSTDVLAARGLLSIYAVWRADMEKQMQAVQVEFASFCKQHKIG